MFLAFVKKKYAKFPVFCVWNEAKILDFMVKKKIEFETITNSRMLKIY